MFRDAVADFAEHEVRPRVREMERAGRIDPTLIPHFYSLGLMGIEVPEQYGGAGGSLMMVTLAVESDQPGRRGGGDHGRRAEHARQLPDHCATGATTSSAVPAAADERYGRRVRAVGAGLGSDAFGLQTTAARPGDHYVLNGRKMWITNGAEAEIFVVFANADREAGYKGITAFIVERDFPGFRVGKKEDKLGIRASSTVELMLDGVRGPRRERAGPRRARATRSRSRR